MLFLIFVERTAALLLSSARIGLHKHIQILRTEICGIERQIHRMIIVSRCTQITQRHIAVDLAGVLG